MKLSFLAESIRMFYRINLVIFFVMASACTRRVTQDSPPLYLTEGNYQCYEPDSARLAEVEALLPNGFISEKFGQQKPMVLKRLAGIPNPYLLHLVERFNKRAFSGVAPASLGGGVAGVTQLEGQSYEELYATSIVVGMDKVGFALQHEVGHAVETFVKLESRKKGINFDSGFQSIYREAQSTPRVRGYAKSADSESWAEAFANFYCSQESKNFIDGGSGNPGMPKTSSFLTSVLLNPIWQQSGGGSGGQNPNPSTSEIFAFLDSSKSTDKSYITVNFSTSSDTGYVEFCENALAADCKSDSANYQRVDGGIEKPGRKFFAAKNTTALVDGLIISMVARKSSGEVISTRSLQVSRTTGS